MDKFMETAESINAAVNDVVWGVPMLVLLLAVGVYLSFGTKFFQITKFGYALKNTIFAVFKSKDATRSKDKNAISQFQALQRRLRQRSAQAILSVSRRQSRRAARVRFFGCGYPPFSG